jgi:hypothetical protein
MLIKMVQIMMMAMMIRMVIRRMLTRMEMDQLRRSSLVLTWMLTCLNRRATKLMRRNLTSTE